MDVQRIIGAVDVTESDTPRNLLCCYVYSLLCLVKYTIQVHRLHLALNSDRLLLDQSYVAALCKASAAQ